MIYNMIVSIQDLEIVIMCGGSGQRFFPLSRENYPKQFIKFDFLDGLSLFQTTVQRALEITSLDKIIFSTNKDYKFSVLGQLEDLGIKIEDSQLLLEPERWDTMAAICFAMQKLNNKALFLCSDHFIEDQSPFVKALTENISLSNQALVLFGIEPQYPSTKYGYFKLEENTITNFIEKPSKDTASELISENYLWNSGIFLIDKELFLKEIEEKHAQYINLCNGKIIAEELSQLDKISFDYAFLEKSSCLKGVSINLNWMDIGSFDSLSRLVKKDKEWNNIENNSLFHSSKNNFISKDNNKLAVLVGVDNLNVIDTDDVLLIAPKNTSGNSYKNIVEKLKTKNDMRYKFGTLDYRPWGYYEVLEEKPFYKVKRLVIFPGKKLSLQSHEKRNEHWVVVSGKAQVINGDEDLTINTNESVYIPAGNKHRLANPFDENLEVIEVQTGAYLGEDDIKRYEDIYQRELKV